MKTFRAVSLSVISVCCAFVFLATALLVSTGPGASALSATAAPQTQTIYCASDDMLRHTCPIDTRGGVQLSKQKSDAKCIYGSTWGYDDRGIWVDRGCRADFNIGAYSPGNGSVGDSQSVYCASDDMHRKWCPVDTRGGIQMIKQRSEAKCVQDSTWGYDRQGVWVDRGCRADFRAITYSRRQERDDDRDRDRRSGSGPSQSVYCASDDMHRHTCPIDARGGVELIKQKSGSPCIYDRTWGYDDGGIWVDRGCRADFEIGAVDWGGWGESFNIYCASDDMGRNWCPVDSRRGARLIRQRSEAACILGQTWGYGPRGIWVDRGCRADFRVAGDWNTRAVALTYCASDDMRRHGCAIDTRDGVFIVRQRSDADCIYDRTWGYDRRGIWVDRGCRADFEIIDRRTEEWRDWDDRHEHHHRDDRPN